MVQSKQFTWKARLKSAKERAGRFLERRFDWIALLVITLLILFILVVF